MAEMLRRENLMCSVPHDQENEYAICGRHFKEYEKSLQLTIEDSTWFGACVFCAAKQLHRVADLQALIAQLQGESNGK